MMARKRKQKERGSSVDDTTTQRQKIVVDKTVATDTKIVTIIARAQKGLTELESGDLVTFLDKPVLKMIMNSWGPINVMQHKLLEAAGYTYPVMKDPHTVVNMINDKETGVFNASAILFEDPDPNHNDDPDIFNIGPAKPTTLSLPYSSDIERFYRHCAAYRLIVRENLYGNRNDGHPNPLLSRLPYSVYIDMLNSVATKNGHENFEHGGLFEKFVIVREIWSIARTKAALGVTETMAERYQVKYAIDTDREDKSYLDIDIDELDTNEEKNTTCTFYVRGEAMLTWKTADCGYFTGARATGSIGYNDPFAMTLMFPKYRARFVEWARADADSWVSDMTDLTQKFNGL
jgi:hypothetical protein